MKNIKDIKNNLNKAQLVNALIQKNIKGGMNCPPPWEVDNPTGGGSDSTGGVGGW